MNKINSATLNLIKEFEGKVLKAYKDPIGIWTIGYGHTAMAGPPVPKAGMVITDREAEELLIKDLRKYEDAVLKVIKVPVNDNQYGAMVSLCFNVGPGNFQKSTLVKKVNAKDFAGAAREFAKWNKAGGKVLLGLTRRRAAEAKLFAKGATEVTHVVVDDPGVEVPKVVKPSVRPPTGFLKELLNFITQLFRKK